MASLVVNWQVADCTSQTGDWRVASRLQTAGCRLVPLRAALVEEDASSPGGRGRWTADRWLTGCAAAGCGGSLVGGAVVPRGAAVAGWPPGTQADRR